jgi:phage FluMu protein Com
VWAYYGKIRCTHCGDVVGEPGQQCGWCDGRGEIIDHAGRSHGKCPRCRGEGKL